MANKVQKWGNSNGIRIPKVYLEALNLKSGDAVNITREGEQIIVTKALRKPESLKTRIKKYKSCAKVEEFAWDEAKGREIW